MTVLRESVKVGCIAQQIKRFVIKQTLALTFRHVVPQLTIVETV